MNLTRSSNTKDVGLHNRIYDYLDQLKAIDVVSIDLSEKSSLADYMIIASGSSQRHVIAMAEKVMEFLRCHGIQDVHVEGLQYGQWVLIDGGDVIIHLFQPEVRQFYNLEKMWDTDFESLRLNKASSKK